MSIWICRGCVMGVSSVSENHSKALWKSNMWGHTYIDKTSCTSQSRFPSVLAPGEVPVVMPCVMQDQAKKDKNNKNKGSQTPRCCQSIICCLDWIPGHQQPGVVLLSLLWVKVTSQTWQHIFTPGYGTNKGSSRDSGILSHWWRGLVWA